MAIRQAEPRDLARIVEIQRATPEAAQWQPADYARLLADASGLLLMVEIGAPQPEVAAFAAVLRLGREAELRNLAVDPAFRRQGVGRALVEEAHRRLRTLGVAQIDLEVRSSNAGARALYEGCGYQLAFVRRAYYHNPAEDALVLRASL